MCVLQPYDAPLRRNYLPGVKVEYSVSPRQKFYRVKVNRIQVRRYDN
jgi:vacuolar protein sorting-associated protein 13A/C